MTDKTTELMSVLSIIGTYDKYNEPNKYGVGRRTELFFLYSELP